MRDSLRPLGALLALLTILAGDGCMPEGLAPTPSAALSQDAQTATAVVVGPTATFGPTATPSPTAPTSPTPAVRIVPGPLPPGLKVLFAEGFEGEGKSVIWMANVDDLTQVQIIATFPYGPPDLGGPPGGYVSPDGRKLAYILPGTHIQDGTLGVMNVDGSDHRTLASPVLGWGTQRDFAWSPDAQWCAYLVADASSPGNDQVWVTRVDGSAKKLLATGGTVGLLGWADAEGLIFTDNGDLKSFDGTNVSSEQGPPTEDADYCELGPGAQRIACVREGSALLQVASMHGKETLSLPQQLTRKEFGFENYRLRPVWSPDGKQVAYNPIVDGTHTALVVADVDTGATQTLLRSDDEVYHLPISWSPDGRYILAWVRQPLGDAGRFREELIGLDGSLRKVERLRSTSLPLGFVGWLQE